MAPTIGFRGFGYAVPPHVRTREDPIYDGVRAATKGGHVTESDLFGRSLERRYLKPGETIEDLMIDAGKAAIADAGLTPADIDRLYGYSTVSEYIEPNGLYLVHHGLGLSRQAMVIPLNNSFTNFITGAMLGWEAILSGHCQQIMVNVGSGMSRNVNYESPHSLSTGDGAGAAILGVSDRNVIIDYAEETYTGDELYRSMTIKPRINERNGIRTVSIDEHGLPIPMFEINDAGLRSFFEHGLKGPPRIIDQMLERHGISREDLALIGHQGPNALMDGWAELIRPKQYLHTMEQYGALALASVPVTLASCIAEVKTKYLVLVSPGTGVHFGVLLIRL